MWEPEDSSAQRAEWNKQARRSDLYQFTEVIITALVEKGYNPDDAVTRAQSLALSLLKFLDEHTPLD